MKLASSTNPRGFNFSNDVWYGDFVIQSEEAALGGYDGGMARSESDYEKTAILINFSQDEIKDGVLTAW